MTATASAYELTWNSVLSGILPSRWLTLLTLYNTKSGQDTVEKNQEDACNALLKLLDSFPGADLIFSYLETALEEDGISLPLYIATFPAAILSSSTLGSKPDVCNRLAALALRFHQTFPPGSSSMAPPPPPVLLKQNGSRNAETTESVISLLKASYGASVLGALNELLKTILMLLLSAISSSASGSLPPLSRVSLLGSLSELIQMYPLDNTAGLFESWMMSYEMSSGLIDVGDDMSAQAQSGNLEGLFDEQKPSQEGGHPNKGTDDYIQLQEDLVAPSAVLRYLCSSRSSKRDEKSFVIDPIAALLSIYRGTMTVSTARVPHRTGNASGLSPSSSLHPRPSNTSSVETPGANPPPRPAQAGRTPSAISGSIPSSTIPIPVHTPNNAVHTPAGRTPGNPRTPGTGGKMTRTPTKDGRVSLGQLRAQVFHEKLLIAMTSLVAQARHQHQPSDKRTVCSEYFLRCAFTFGKLPRLLVKLRHSAVASSSSLKAAQPDFRLALENAVTDLFSSHGSLLDNASANKPRPSDTELQTTDNTTVAGSGEDAEKSKKWSFRRNLLVYLARADAISDEFATTLLMESQATDNKMDQKDHSTSLEMQHDGSLSLNEPQLLPPSKFSQEANRLEISMEAYFLSRLQEASGSDFPVLLEEVLEDFAVQDVFAFALRKTLESASEEGNVQRLGTLANTLLMNGLVLDVVALHVPIHDIIYPCLVSIEDFDYDAVVDPQSIYPQIGSTILLLQACVLRFTIQDLTFHKGDRVLSGAWLTDCFRSPLPSFSEADQDLMDRWNKSIFENSMEGISDELLGSTPPKLLLQMAPSLFCSAIEKQNIQFSALQSGGISFFLGALLNWSLVGVLRVMIAEALRLGFSSGPYLQSIQAIVLDSNCPHVIHQMCGRPLLRLLTEGYMKGPLMKNPLNLIGMADAIRIALDIPKLGPTPIIPVKDVLQSFARATYDNHPPPSLDELHFESPRTLLDVTCAVAISTAKAGDPTRTARQLAMCLFYSPPSQAVSPLLRFFVLAYLPSVLSPLDRRAKDDLAEAVKGLTALTAWCLLLAFRAERAYTDVAKAEGMSDSPAMDVDEGPTKLGTPEDYETIVLVTELSKALMAHHGPSASQLRDALIKYPQFVSNFSTFGSS